MNKINISKFFFILTLLCFIGWSCATEREDDCKTSLQSLPFDILAVIILDQAEPVSPLEMTTMCRGFNEWYKGRRGVDLVIDGDKVEDFFSEISFPYKIKHLRLSGNWKDKGTNESFHKVFERTKNIDGLDLSEISLDLQDAIILASCVPRSLPALGLHKVLAPLPDEYGRIPNFFKGFPLGLTTLTLGAFSEKYSVWPSKVLPCLYDKRQIKTLKIQRHLPELLPEGLNSLTIENVKFGRCEDFINFVKTLPDSLRYFSILDFDGSFSLLQTILDSLPKKLETFTATRSYIPREEMFMTGTSLSITHLTALNCLTLDGFGLISESQITASQPIKFSANPTTNPILNRIISGETVVDREEYLQLDREILLNFAEGIVTSYRQEKRGAQQRIKASLDEFRKKFGEMLEEHALHFSVDSICIDSSLSRKNIESIPPEVSAAYLKFVKIHDNVRDAMFLIEFNNPTGICCNIMRKQLDAMHNTINFSLVKPITYQSLQENFEAFNQTLILPLSPNIDPDILYNLAHHLKQTHPKDPKGESYESCQETLKHTIGLYKLAKKRGYKVEETFLADCYYEIALLMDREIKKGGRLYWRNRNNRNQYLWGAVVRGQQEALEKIKAYLSDDKLWEEGIDAKRVTLEQMVNYISSAKNGNWSDLKNMEKKYFDRGEFENALEWRKKWKQYKDDL